MTIEQAKEKLSSLTSRKDNLLESFHGGKVGFRKDTKKHNQEQERQINAAIEISNLRKFIEAEELKKAYNAPEAVEQRTTDKQSINERLAEYWRNLKPGDRLEVGNPNGNPTIKKKNAKSVETETGSKWSAAEIIGKEAAKLI